MSPEQVRRREFLKKMAAAAAGQGIRDGAARVADLIETVLDRAPAPVTATSADTRRGPTSVEDSAPGTAESNASEPALAPSDRARVVADFIAGMTDRYAVKEHERLTGQRLLG